MSGGSAENGGGGARGRGRTPSWSPNENVTVVKSRPVQYLLMKLRDVNTQGRVRKDIEKIIVLPMYCPVSCCHP